MDDFLHWTTGGCYYSYNNVDYNSNPNGTRKFWEYLEDIVDV